MPQLQQLRLPLPERAVGSQVAVVGDANTDAGHWWHRGILGGGMPPSPTHTHTHPPPPPSDSPQGYKHLYVN